MFLAERELSYAKQSERYGLVTCLRGGMEDVCGKSTEGLTVFALKGGNFH